MRFQGPTVSEGMGPLWGCNMSFSQPSRGIYERLFRGIVVGGTRSLDDGSYEAFWFGVQSLEFRVLRVCGMGRR